MYKGKTTFDFCTAAVGLTVLSPLIVIAAFARAAEDRIRHGTKRSLKEQLTKGLFYLDDRLGEDGKVFKAFKIKTMRDKEYENQPDSERTGFVGLALRKTKLDETPQFLNVLFGQMSIIGPRPLHVSAPENQLLLRSMSRPGIFSTATALAVRNLDHFKTPQDLDDHITSLCMLDWCDAEQSSFKHDQRILMLHVKNSSKIFAAKDHRNIGPPALE